MASVESVGDAVARQTKSKSAAPLMAASTAEAKMTTAQLLPNTKTNTPPYTASKTLIASETGLISMVPVSAKVRAASV